MTIQNTAQRVPASGNSMKVNNFMVENSSKAREPRSSNIQENMPQAESKFKSTDPNMPMKLSEIIQNKNQFSAVIAKPKIGNTISLNRKKMGTPIGEAPGNPLG
jgi:hypothetical protein